MSIADKLTTIAENIENVYNAGANDFGIPATASGKKSVRLDYLNPNRHNISVQLSSDTISDFSSVSIMTCGKNMLAVGDFVATGSGVGKAVALFSIENVFEENKQYTLSMEVESEGVTYSESGNLLYTQIDYTDGYSDYVGITDSNYQSGTLAFTTRPNKTVKKIKNFNAQARWTGGTLSVSHIQLEEGTARTEYEEYKGENYTPNADGTLKVKSINAPYMWVFSNEEDINISCRYYKQPSNSVSDVMFSNIRSFYRIFYQSTWEEGTDLILDISKHYEHSYYDLQYAFGAAKGLRSVKIIATEKNPTHYGNAFNGFKGEMIDLSECPNVISLASAFIYGGSALKEIKGELDCSYVTAAGNLGNNSFGYCYGLEEVRFKPNTIPFSIGFLQSTKLSRESIISIINGLSPTVTGMSVTVSKTAKENAFTDEEWAQLIATKPNWTINLA